jgi:hypothetical protein
VGKTCLIEQYANNKFNEFQIPSTKISNSTVKTIVDDKYSQLNICDAVNEILNLACPKIIYLIDKRTASEDMWNSACLLCCRLQKFHKSWNLA